MRALYLLSVWLHIMAAAVWIGGMVFLVLVLLPVVRRRMHEGTAPGLIHWTGLRFRTVGWVCMGFLVLSGILNLALRGIGWSHLWDGGLWRSAFGRILGIKLLLVSAILLLGAGHDFIIGPRATARWQAHPSSPEARRLRRQAAWLGRLSLLLSLLVVALGVMLVRGAPW